MSSAKPRILFLCIGNSCRSPMAESIALRDYAELFDVSSAGISPLGVIQPMTLTTLRANSYPVAGLSSKSIRSEVWTESSLVINMSGYHRHRAFPKDEWHKLEDWDVEDPYGCSAEVYQRTFDDIRNKIKSLAGRFQT